MSLISRLDAHESGELSEAQSLLLFAELIRTGAAWSLQGSYGQVAEFLINNEFLTRQGELTRRGDAIISAADERDEGQ